MAADKMALVKAEKIGDLLVLQNIEKKGEIDRNGHKSSRSVGITSAVNGSL